MLQVVAAVITLLVLWALDPGWLSRGESKGLEKRGKRKKAKR